MGYHPVGLVDASTLDRLHHVVYALGAIGITTASAMSEVEATKAQVDLTWFAQALGLTAPRYGWVRFVTLGASQQIVAHRDAPYTEQPFDRYHVPVQNNPQCWSFADGRWQRLTLGGIYWMDPTAEHGAVNWGATPRVHLLIDVLR